MGRCVAAVCVCCSLVCVVRVASANGPLDLLQVRLFCCARLPTLSLQTPPAVKRMLAFEVLMLLSDQFALV